MDLGTTSASHYCYLDSKRSVLIRRLYRDCYHAYDDERKKTFIWLKHRLTDTYHTKIEAMHE